MKQQKNQRPSHQAAFSLVEVSIAMAIAAVALVSLIGLIPQGMKTMQDAGDQAITARIHQQILSELQLTPFRPKSNVPDLSLSPLKPFHNQVRIYDAQGVELGYTSGGSLRRTPGYDDQRIDFEWNYSARIWLPAFESGRVPESVGGGTTEGVIFDVDGKPNPDLLQVIIEVVSFQFPGDTVEGRVANAESFLSDPENFRSIDTYQTTIVRMGNDFTSN